MKKKDDVPNRLDADVMHPIQPLVVDDHGVVRFKENKIVSYLLDCCRNGVKSDMNRIAKLDFSQEDREQFAQLIGYSHSGASDLHYMRSEILDTAENIFIARKNNEDQKDILINNLRSKLRDLRENLADVLSGLFEKHPDDLKGA